MTTPMVCRSILDTYFKLRTTKFMTFGWIYICVLCRMNDLLLNSFTTVHLTEIGLF